MDGLLIRNIVLDYIPIYFAVFILLYLFIGHKKGYNRKCNIQSFKKELIIYPCMARF